MKLWFADLPGDVQVVYQSFDMQGSAAKNTASLGASAVIEAVLVIHNPNGIIYTTRDGGKSFEVSKIAETVQISGCEAGSNAIAVHPLVGFPIAQQSI